jgi:hypothetical protein
LQAERRYARLGRTHSSKGADRQGHRSDHPHNDEHFDERKPTLAIHNRVSARGELLSVPSSDDARGDQNLRFGRVGRLLVSRLGRRPCPPLVAAHTQFWGYHCRKLRNGNESLDRSGWARIDDTAEIIKCTSTM